MTCSFCGAPGNWRELIRAPWERRAVDEGWKRQTAPMFRAETINYALQAGAMYKKQRPIRPAEFDSDVRVPLMQSLITAVAGGMAVGSIAHLCKADMSLWWGVAGGATTWTVSWIALLWVTRRLLWEVERLVGRDLDKDNIVGDPARREPIQVEITERDQRGRLRQMRWFEFPPDITDNDLSKLAKALIVDNLPFSRRKLASVLSADKVSTIQDVLLDRKAARYVNGRNKANGIELRASGEAFFEQYLVVVGGGGR